VLVVVDVLTPVVPPVVVVALTPVVPTPVVVVVSFVLVWAKALLNATALTAPTTNNLLSDVCFMFVLCLGSTDALRRAVIRLFQLSLYSPNTLISSPEG